MSLVCCENCFHAPELKQAVRGEGTVGICPLCGSVGVHLFDSSQSSLDRLSDIINVLVTAYIPYDASRHAGVAKEFVKSLPTHLKAVKRLFRLPVRHIRTVLEGVGQESKYLDGKVIPKFLNPEMDFSELSVFKDGNWKFDDFVFSLHHKKRFHSGESIRNDNLNLLFSECSEKISAGAVFHRARVVLAEEALSPDAVGAPPANMAKDGRVSPAGIPVLYLADSENTALSEIRSRVTDHVFLAQFMIEKDVNILDLTRLKDMSPFAVSNDFAFYLMNYPVVEKMASVFTSPVRSKEICFDYLATQFLCEHARTNGWHGVKYASTIAPHGYNLALFNPNDAKVVVASMKHILISACPRYRGVEKSDNF